MTDSPLLARKDAAGNTQTLASHLSGAAELARSFEPEFSSISYLAALLHDVGKATGVFQDYLMSDDGKRGSVIHAWQGAFVINDLPADNSIAKLTQEILELAISKHHGSLPDCINSDGTDTFFRQATGEE